MSEKSQITVKAVLAEAQRLRERAERIRRNDPWAKPYDPSDAVARKLSQQHGPQHAIEVMNTRAADVDEEYRLQCERSERAARRHRRHLDLVESARRAKLSGLSIGQRLDRALRGLGAATSVPAAALDAPKVHGGTPDRSPRPVESDSDRFRNRGLLLVKQAEDALERATPADLWPEDAA